NTSSGLASGLSWARSAGSRQPATTASTNPLNTRFTDDLPMFTDATTPSRRRVGPRAVPLRGVADDDAQGAARQHDLPPVLPDLAQVLRQGDQEGQERQDGEAEHDPQRQRLELLREIPDQPARQQAFEHRAEDDADDLRSHLRLGDECRQPVEDAQEAA